jgi:hypothetical protein
MKWISVEDRLPGDIDMLKQGKIRLVSKARARKLKKKVSLVGGRLNFIVALEQASTETTEN